MRRLAPLICLALTHTLVDTCALLIAPLWPRLNTVYAFSVAGLSLAFIVQSLPTSISQVVFGYLRDRRPGPLWLWLGPAMAAVFLTSIGLIEHRAVLFTLLIIGGIGVGAFHPEAAVLAGKLIPGERTKGISMFMFGGSLGLALGPILSGIVVGGWSVTGELTVGGWGLSGLVLLMLPVLVAIFALRKIGRLAEAETLISQYHTPGSDTNAAEDASTPSTSLREMLEGRAGFAVVLLLVCSLRLVPNMAMDKVLAFTLKQPHWGYDEAMIGVAQSVFLIAASVGMFFMVFRFRAGLEKAFLVACPLLAVPLMLILGWKDCPPWLFFTTIALSGIVLWGTSPAMVSYAQQQFPKGAGFASALTMGMAWGIGGLIQAPLTSYFENIGNPQLTFVACVPCLLVAGIVAIFMPPGRPDVGAQAPPKIQATD
ncbi:MAG: MFS transporter [Planctomycetes bacterium]|nr:MFS transporter [Planctomycetota bacterium]